MFFIKRNSITTFCNTIFFFLLIVLFTSCASQAYRENFTEKYLLSDMPRFSVNEFQENSYARNWYFASYTSIIPQVKTFSGSYLSSGEILVAHMLIGNDVSQGTVIMIHGYNGSVLNTHFQYFAQQFILKGYRVILLNLPGHGFSGGERGAIENFTDYGTMLRDFLILNNGQLGKKIALIGHSTGAVSIYEAYIKYPHVMEQIDASVLISPFKDLKFSNLMEFGSFFVSNIDIEQEKTLGLKSVPSSWIQREQEWSKKAEHYPILDTKEILLVFGKDDNVIKVEESILFYEEKIKNHVLHIYEEQGHILTNPGYKDFRTETFSWLMQQLSYE